MCLEAASTHPYRRAAFTCDVCKKSFKLPNTLKNHLRIDTGEEPFTCDTCNKSFKWSDNLKFHLCTHTGEWPFTFDVL